MKSVSHFWVCFWLCLLILTIQASTTRVLDSMKDVMATMIAVKYNR